MSENQTPRLSGLAAARKEIPTLYPYLHRYWKGLALGMLCVAITALTANVTPLLVSRTFNHIASSSNVIQIKAPLAVLEAGILSGIGQSRLIPIAWKLQSRPLERALSPYVRKENKLGLYFGALMAFALVSALFRYYQRWIIIGISRQIEYDQRNDLFEHLLKLPPSYFDRMTTGDIIARATNDMNQVRSMLGPGLMYPVNAVCMMIGALAGMFYLSSSLTFVALIPSLMMAIGTNRLAKVVHDRFTEVQEQFSAISSRVQENLAGMRVVKAYVREESEVEAVRLLNIDYLAKNLRYFKAEGVLYPFFSFSHNLGRFVILTMGGYLMLYHSDRFNIGDFAAFLLYLGMLLFPMISIGWVLNVIQRGVASLARINEVMNEVPEIRDKQNPVTAPPAKGGVLFRNVSFGYTPDRLILKDINLAIPPGAMLGIVGPTGSGKSTLINLMPRFRDPLQGEIEVDGVNVKDYSLKALRQSIGLVSQDHFMFSNTVGKNIGFGLQSEDPEMDETILKASDLASFHENVLEFPQGYETMVGERGITLSGGQRQRAAIARAMAINPSLLILDDALSAVDTHTEERILQGLKRVAAGRTVLLISHRISAVQHADWIIVLDDGRITEQGKHADLIAQNGLYASIHKHQLLEAELEEMTA